MFDYQKIVVILPERLGDALFHTPSIRLLKKTLPNLQIGIIALSELSAGVMENNPYIDRIYTAPSRHQLKEIAKLYDVAVIAHNHAPARQCAERLELPTITVRPVEGVAHQAQHSFEFFRQLLKASIEPDDMRYTLFPRQENFSHIDRLLARESYDSSREILIGCHIGCHSIAKKDWKIWRPMTHPKAWAFENFLKLEAMLREHEPRIRFVLTGSKAEKRLGQKFKHHAPTAINLIDRTSVLDLTALMERLHLFVTSDTGALHVACASSTGIIALFGHSLPEHTGPHPMQPHYRIVQASSLDQISTAEVHDAVLRALPRDLIIRAI